MLSPTIVFRGLFSSTFTLAVDGMIGFSFTLIIEMLAMAVSDNGEVCESVTRTVMAYDDTVS